MIDFIRCNLFFLNIYKSKKQVILEERVVNNLAAIYSRTPRFWYYVEYLKAVKIHHSGSHYLEYIKTDCCFSWSNPVFHIFCYCSIFNILTPSYLKLFVFWMFLLIYEFFLLMQILKAHTVPSSFGFQAICNWRLFWGQEQSVLQTIDKLAKHLND